jgi:hypothetical protein
MRRNHLIAFSVATIGLCLSLSSCKDEEVTAAPCNDPANWECPNYDPRLSVQQPSAAFVMLDSTFNADSTISMPFDTANSEVAIKYFRPVEIKDKTTYEWKIGTDPRVFTDPILRMDFTSFEGIIPIRLIAKRTDPLNCLEPGQRSDTSYQQMVLKYIPPGGSPIYGAYSGFSSDDPTRIFTVELSYYINSNNTPVTRLTGLTLDCDPFEPGIDVGGGYDWFITDHGNRPRCRRLTAIGRLQENDHRILKVDYWYNDDSGARKHAVFTGVRQ